jgi:3-oxoacyl-[acyl-carrier-protein] synthase-3
MSRLVDWKDRTTCVLFGDGAGAVVLQGSKEPGILSTHLRSDGRYVECLEVPTGISRNREQFDRGETYIRMRGAEVFKAAVTCMEEGIDEALAANGLNKGDIDWLVPHQANMRIISALARKLDLPIERVVVTVGEHGNTSAASVPLALDKAVRDGRIQRGHTVLLNGFGGGYTWGTAVLRY